MLTLPMPSGDIGTMFTLATMRALVRREYLLPIVRLTATNIVRGLGGKDGAGQAYEIRNWLDARIEFLRDPDGIELMHGPSWQLRRILTQGHESLDCDDVAMLSAALGLSIALRARFVLLAFDKPHAPFQHVYTELSPHGAPRWVDMDITRSSQGLPFNRISRTFYKEV